MLQTSQENHKEINRKLYNKNKTIKFEKRKTKLDFNVLKR